MGHSLLSRKTIQEGSAEDELQEVDGNAETAMFSSGM